MGKKKCRAGTMRARLRFAITIIRAEPLRRLGAQICIETLAKVMKSPSTEWLFDPMVAKADSGVREIFVRLAPALALHTLDLDMC
jgi:hypothetical protein